MYLLEPFEGLLGELVVCAVLLEVLPEAWEDGLEVFEGSGHLCGGAGCFAAGDGDSRCGATGRGVNEGAVCLAVGSLRRLLHRAERAMVGGQKGPRQRSGGAEGRSTISI